MYMSKYSESSISGQLIRGGHLLLFTISVSPNLFQLLTLLFRHFLQAISVNRHLYMLYICVYLYVSIYVCARVDAILSICI